MAEIYHETTFAYAILGACKHCLRQDQSIPTQNLVSPEYNKVMQVACRQREKEPHGKKLNALGRILHLQIT